MATPFVLSTQADDSRAWLPLGEWQPGKYWTMRTPEAAPDHVRSVALTSATRLVRKYALIALASLALAILLLVVVSPRFVWPLIIASLTWTVLFGVGSYRALRARQAIASEDGTSVRFEGWRRSPDGCNYAMFPSDAPSAVPAAVLHLPLVRRMSSGSGWLFESSRSNAAAPAGADGELLAVGRLVDDGLDRWHRRHERSRV